MRGKAILLIGFRAMTPNAITLDRPRPVTRTLFAAVVLVFAAAIAPICALTAACSMPCCEGNSFPLVQSAAAAACAEHCGISSDASSQELPNAIPPSGDTAKVTLASLAAAEASETLAPTSPPRLPAFSAESHHAVPGDAPVYLYNSVFLI
jgi:hypothetical protein